jgi:Zn-dependent M28 family amino/carboxypeptidase
MKKLFFLAGVFSCSIAIAQQDFARKYAETISQEDLKKNLTILASDAMEGRETGTEGQRKAAAFIEGFFSAAGLKIPAPLKKHQQFYPLYQDSIKSIEFEVEGRKAISGKDFISPANANETGKFKGKEMVFVGYGIEDDKYNDYATLDVKDKLVVFFLGEPRKDGIYLLNGSNRRGSEWTFPGLSKKLALAAKKGAAGALVISPTQESFSAANMESARKSNVYYPREVAGKKLNYALLSHAFAKSVFGPRMDSLLASAKSAASFSNADYFNLKQKVKYKLKKDRQVIYASNVLGVIEGSDKKDEYLFITAHYDHLGTRNGVVYNGADDDGSGTVSVMQIGAAFAKAKAEGHGPRRTVVIMTVSGEEKGLLGSEYYSEHPVYPLEKTTADLNIDMVGRIDTERMKDDTLNYVYVVGHNKLSSVINEAANNKYTNLVLDYKYDDPADPNRIYFRSDHYNFARKGVPVLFFYDGMLKADYHKPTDTVEKINFPLMEKRARMVFYTAWEMANRDEQLKRDIPLSSETR